MDSWWLVAMVVAVMITVAPAFMRRRQERRRLLDLAARRGLKFSPVDLIGLHERYYNLELVRQGHSRYAWNVLYGSTDVGLVALFRYSFDLGFGIHQSARQVWVAVLEGTPLTAHWSAQSRRQASEPGLRGPVAGSTRIAMNVGPFLCTVDHQVTADLLSISEIREWLAARPADQEWEARGPLLAVTAPAESTGPEPLLDHLCELARILGRHVHR